MPMWSKHPIGEGSNDALRAMRKEATNVRLKEEKRTVQMQVTCPTQEKNNV